MESWFRMLSPALSLRLPASGDVSMDYSPWTNWGIARPRPGTGIPEIEAEVFSGVALPGKQLGKLTEATLALSRLVESVHPDVLERHPDDAKAIEELEKLRADIEQRKEEHKKTAKEQAEQAMELLKQTDPSAYRSYVDQLHRTDNT